jgi:hypothetical protein
VCKSRYEDIAEASFGKPGREIMTAILYTELIGTCALFLILQKGASPYLLNFCPALQCMSCVLSSA